MGQLLTDHRTFFGFYSNGNNFLAHRIFYVTGNAGNRSAGAHTGNQNINSPLGIIPYFRTGRFFMNRRVGRILELLRQVIFLRVRCGNGFRLIDRAFHAFRAGCKDKIGAKSRKDFPALNTHRLRHSQRKLVTARRRDIGQGDTRVAAGWLDDFHAGLEQPFFLGIPDHSRPNPALNRIRGIAPLDFRQNGCLGACCDMV